MEAMMGKTWQRWLLVVSMVCIVPLAFAQTYPNHAIRLVVPFPAGGTTDILARDVAKKLTDTLGQAVGGQPARSGGTTSVPTCGQGRPDGYIPADGHRRHTRRSISACTRRCRYDHIKDLRPVVLVAGVPNVPSSSTVGAGKFGCRSDQAGKPCK
jgi:tripartite-type tricarboxylate transporter receptor subunit TctC